MASLSTSPSAFASLAPEEICALLSVTELPAVLNDHQRLVLELHIKLLKEKEDVKDAKARVKVADDELKALSAKIKAAYAALVESIGLGTE